MSILVNSETRLIVQGITGREGSFHTGQMVEYGTNVVGGVTPGGAGKEVSGVPVFNTVRDAVASTELLRLDDGLAGAAAEAFEHQGNLFPYFLWTACRVTPSASAMCCHGQPSRRARSTWSVSRRSASTRSERTARNPSAGSSPEAAVIRSLDMTSTYVDMARAVNRC